MGEFDHLLPPDNSQTTGEFDHLLSPNTQNVTKTNILDNYGNVIPQTAFQNPSQNISENNSQNPQGFYQTLRNIIAYPESGITGLLAGIGQYSGLNDGNSGNLQKSLETANQKMQSFQTNAQKNQGLAGAISDPINAAMMLQPESYLPKTALMSIIGTPLVQGLGQAASHYANTDSPTLAGTTLAGVAGALIGGLGKVAQTGTNKIGDAADEWLTKYKNLKNLPEGLGDLTESDLAQMAKMQAESIPELPQDHTYISPDATKIPSMGSQTLEQYMEPGSFATQHIFGKGPTKVSEVALAHMLGSFHASIPLATAMGIDYLEPSIIPSISKTVIPYLGNATTKLAPLFTGIGAQYITNKNIIDKGKPLQ